MQKELDILSFEIEKIDSEINLLKIKRLCAETKIIELIGKKDEGTKTCTSEFYRTSITGKVTRTFDKNFEPSALRNAIGVEIADKLIRPKYELATSAYRSLTDEQKVILSQFITTKPAKTSIKIDRLEVNE